MLNQSTRSYLLLILCARPRGPCFSLLSYVASSCTELSVFIECSTYDATPQIKVLKGKSLFNVNFVSWTHVCSV